MPIYFDDAPTIVIRKPSQVGITEYCLVAMWTDLCQRRPGLYVLPTNKWMQLFCASRIKQTTQQVGFYKDAMNWSDADVDNVEMMTFFGVNVKFIGPNKEFGFYEFPGTWATVDEYDLCDPANLVLLEDRLGATEHPGIRRVGNPTIPGIGIDAELDLSDYKQWFIQCPGCNQWQTPGYFTHVVRETDDGKYELRDQAAQKHIDQEARGQPFSAAMEIVKYQHKQERADARLLCEKCEKPIDRLSPGYWVPTHPGRITSGYAVNKVFADYRQTPVILDMYQSHQESKASPAKLQRFYQKLLGEPFEGEGSRFTGRLLQQCGKQYEAPLSLPATLEVDGKEYPITEAIAGVDVGARLHVNISAILDLDGRTRVLPLLWVGTCTWEDLGMICKIWNITKGVLDADPETTKAREWCREARDKEWGSWWMCRFQHSISDRKLVKNRAEKLVKVNRTEAFDVSFEQAMEQRLWLPIDHRTLDHGDWMKQMMAPVRTFVEAAGSRPGYYVWDEKGKPDHHCLANVYKNVAAQMVGSTDFTGMWV